MVEPQDWEIPYLQRIEEINQEIRLITLEGFNEEFHQGEIFSVYQTEPTPESIRQLNAGLRELGAQVVEIHWHGGWDEDLNQLEGPSWTVDVLLTGDADDEDVTREGREVGLELLPIDMGFFWRREGMEA